MMLTIRGVLQGRRQEEQVRHLGLESSENAISCHAALLQVLYSVANMFRGCMLYFHAMERWWR